MNHFNFISIIVGGTYNMIVEFDYLLEDPCPTNCVGDKRGGTDSQIAPTVTKPEPVNDVAKQGKYTLVEIQFPNSLLICVLRLSFVIHDNCSKLYNYLFDKHHLRPVIYQVDVNG